MSYSRVGLDELFEQLNQPTTLVEVEYVPEHVAQGKTVTQIYIPTPLTAGPKPLTLEKYQQRQCKRTQQEEDKHRKKSRGGKAVNLRRKLGELYRVIHLASGENKKKLIAELIKAKEELHDTKYYRSLQTTRDA